MARGRSASVLAVTVVALNGCGGAPASAGGETAHRGDRAYSHSDVSIAAGFTPVFYDHQETLHLDAAPDEVFPLFNPEWRCLWRPTWIQEPVFRRTGEDPGWGVDRVRTPRGAEGFEIFVVVTHVDRVEREMQYTIVWGDWEIQKFRIRCTAGGTGGTDATIRTMTYGLNDFGNQDVTRYSEGGNEAKQNRAYVEAIAHHLADRAERGQSEAKRP